MPKLFIFGIGGTGSRVIKSLSFLMASGIAIKNFTEVVPIIIDPDLSNGDMNRTIEILRNYQRIREKMSEAEEGFFKTKVSTLNEVIRTHGGDHLIREDFKLTLENIQNERFRDFIHLGTMKEESRLLTELLFSEDNLNDTLEIGFKGNPNVGSVVLNQLSESKEWLEFASNFHAGDRIFIISSIFGGTGAAGFPLIVKNLREAVESIPNHKLLRDAFIGAITVLPYFGVEYDENSKINKATFVSKSKAALTYYDKNVNPYVNALYYIGDRSSREYENNPGSIEQRNDAHFVEMAAALAICDFADLTQQEGGRQYFREFGIDSFADVFDMSHLGKRTKSTLVRRLSQYMLFIKYLDDQIQDSIENQPYAIRGKIKIDTSFVRQDYLNSYVAKFNEHFLDWLTELGRNKVAFRPFDLNVGKDNLLRIINHYLPNSSLSKYKNYALFDHYLNKNERKIGDLPIESKFMQLFYNATKELLIKKFNFN